MTHRHWTAGAKLPPAEVNKYRRAVDQLNHPTPHHSIHGAPPRPPDLEAFPFRSYTIAGILAGAVSGGIMGALIMWLIMR